MLIKKNYHVWGSEYPQVIEETPLHITLQKKSLFGEHFGPNVSLDLTSSKTGDGTTITVNSERYGHMVTVFFFACY